MFNPDKLKTISHVGYAINCQFNYQISSRQFTLFFNEIKDEKEVINIIDDVIEDHNILTMKPAEGAYGIGVRFAVFTLYGAEVLPFKNGEKINFPSENVYVEKIIERNWDYQTMMTNLPSKRLKTLF